MSRLKNILIVFSAFLVVAVFYIVIPAFLNYGEKQMRVFSDYLQTYSKKYGTETPAGPITGSLPDNTKAIFISVQGQSKGDDSAEWNYWIGENSSMKIPNGFRAKTIEEMNTLIMIDRTLKEVGFYVGGGRAYVRQTRITIVNAKTNAVVAQKMFEGSDPPWSKNISGDGYGSSPDLEAFRWAINFLKSNG